MGLDDWGDVGWQSQNQHFDGTSAQGYSEGAWAWSTGKLSRDEVKTIIHLDILN